MKCSSKTQGTHAVGDCGKPRGRRVMLMLRWSDYEIIRGVSTYAHEASWIVNDHMTHDFNPNIPEEVKCDGIIAILPAHVTERAASLVCKLGVKVVCLNGEFPQLKIPRIVPDNHAIGKMAAEHLLERGFRRLAFYQAYDAVVERERMEGFRDAALHSGAEFLHLDFSKTHRPEGDVDAFQELTKALRKIQTPVGIMGQYDRSANQVVLACEQAGLTVPDDVAVVGVDNDPISSELGLVPLTSVDSDRFSVGYAGAALLDRLMDGHPPPKTPVRIAPKGIVVRKSTDAIAVDNEELARALRFIWQHFAEPIDAEDVATAAAISRRKLYVLFEKHLKRPVKAEIDRARIKQAQRLLRDTDEKLFSVARSSGFQTAFQLSRVFNRIEGCSPAEFRTAQRHREPKAKAVLKR